MDKKIAKKLEFKISRDNKEYELEVICNSPVDARESEAGHLSGLYNLVSQKDYPKNKNIWEPTSVVQHLRKLVSIFHKNHPNKPTAISLTIDLASPIDKRTASPNVNGKQKYGQLVGSIRKKAKH